jgi:hypothetical protein
MCLEVQTVKRERVLSVGSIESSWRRMKLRYKFRVDLVMSKGNPRV